MNVLEGDPRPDPFADEKPLLSIKLIKSQRTRHIFCTLAPKTLTTTMRLSIALLAFSIPSLLLASPAANPEAAALAEAEADPACCDTQPPIPVSFRGTVCTTPANERAMKLAARSLTLNPLVRYRQPELCVRQRQ